MAPPTSASGPGSALPALNTAWQTPQAPPSPPVTGGAIGSQPPFVPPALQHAEINFQNWWQNQRNYVNLLQGRDQQLQRQLQACQQDKKDAEISHKEALHKKNEELQQMQNAQQSFSQRLQPIQQGRAASEQESLVTRFDLQTKLRDATTEVFQLKTSNETAQILNRTLRADNTALRDKCCKLQSTIDEQRLLGQAQTVVKQNRDTTRLQAVLAGARLTRVYGPKLESLVQANAELDARSTASEAQLGTVKDKIDNPIKQRDDARTKVERLQCSDGYLRTNSSEKEQESEILAREVGGLKDRCKILEEKLRVKSNEHDVERRLHKEKTSKLEACDKKRGMEHQEVQKQTIEAKNLARKLESWESVISRQKETIGNYTSDLLKKGNEMLALTKQLDAAKQEAFSEAQNAAKYLAAQKAADNELKAEKLKIEKAEARATTAEAKLQRHLARSEEAAMAAAMEAAMEAYKRRLPDDDHEGNTAPPSKKQRTISVNKTPLTGPERKPSRV